MFSTGILDTAIGLIFLYALLALVNSALVELVLSYANLRGKNLQKVLQNLLPAGGLVSADDVNTHGAIATLSPGGLKPGLPSYLPPSLFADVLSGLLLDTAAVRQAGQTATDELEALRAALTQNAPPSPANAVLLLALERAQRTVGSATEQLAAFRTELERLYDDTMERAQGWLKRRANTISLVLAFGRCFFVNADSIQIARTLSSDPALRAQIAGMAVEALAQHNAADTATSAAGNCTETLALLKEYARKGIEVPEEVTLKALPCLKAALKDHVETLTTTFPLGWPIGCEQPIWYQVWWEELFTLITVSKVLGLFLSGLAVSLGAAFWFKLLEQVIRLTGRRIPLASETPAGSGKPPVTP